MRIAVASDVYQTVQPKTIDWSQLETELRLPQIGNKDGPVLAFADIPAGACREDAVNMASAIVFDVDNKDEPRITVSECVQALELAGLCAYVHTTYNHCAEEPRFRVIIALDRPLYANLYKAVSESVADSLNLLDHLDKACLHASRRYFLPRCPEDRCRLYEFKSVRGKPLRAEDYISSDLWLAEHGKRISSGPFASKLFDEFLSTESDRYLDNPPTAKQLNESLSYISADCGYEQWRSVVWAILSTGCKEAEPLARSWSESAPNRFEEKAFTALVKSFDETRSPTIATIFKFAKDSGWVPNENITGKDFLSPPELGSCADLQIISKDSERGRFKFRSPHELRKLPAMRWRAKGLLPEQGLASIYGPAGSGKTFLALDLIAKISKGEDFFGIRTNACPVVYVALEGAGGLARRVRAYEEHYKSRLPGSFRIVTESLSLLNTESEAFAQAVSDAGLNGGVVTAVPLSFLITPTSSAESILVCRAVA